MPTRNINYGDIGLDSVDEYWSKLVVPDAQAFRGVASTRSAFHAAQSVWHLHEWVWHERNHGQDTSGAAWTAYREGLVAACPELEWLRNVADASKHRSLNRQVEVRSAGPQLLGRASVDGCTQSPLPTYILVVDGSTHDFAGVLESAIEFWRCRELAAKNLPSPW